MIPENPLFEEFLSGTQLVAGEPAGLARLLFSPNLFLTYPKSKLQLESVLTVIGRALGISSPEVSLAALALCSVSRPPGKPAVAHANECFSARTKAKLRLAVILPHVAPVDEFELNLGDLALGPFDPSAFLEAGKRGGSAWKADLLQHSGQTAILQSVEVNIVNWRVERIFTPLVENLRAHGISGLSGTPEQNVSLGLLLEHVYFDSLFESVLSRLPDHVSEELRLFEAANMVQFPVASVINFPMTLLIGLFEWEDSQAPHTFAVQRDLVLDFNVVPPEVFSRCRDWLEDEFGRSKLTDRLLDKPINTFCRFLQRAQKHRHEHRTDEAFLYFVIALDLLFGVEGTSTQSVASRAATLVHRQLGHSYEEQVRVMKDLYRARSKLVHEGLPARPQQLEQVEAVCLEVLWALLRVSDRKEFQQDSEWLALLDFLGASITANRQPAEVDMGKVGIPPLGRACTRPMIVEVQAPG